MPVWCCWDITYVSLLFQPGCLHYPHHLGRWKGRSLRWHLSNGCQCGLFSPGGSQLSLFLCVFSHYLFLVHCCKINGSKSREASLPVRKAPSVLFSISISVHSVDLTHSYVPLHQWKTKQQLTVVMRTTISLHSHSSHFPSPVQFTVEYISSYWTQEDTLNLALTHAIHSGTRSLDSFHCEVWC